MDVIKSYNLAKLFSEIQKELTDLDTARLVLINKYGKKQENGEMRVTPDSPEQVPFFADFNKLLLEEVSLKKLKKAQLEIKDLKGNQISPAHLDQLEWLFKQ